MKKTLSLFIAPVIAGFIITIALHTFIPYQHGLSYDMLSETGTDITFGLLGFLFGFLPCFIYGYAKYSLLALRGKDAAPEAEIDQVCSPLYIGMVINGGNCQLRVKAVKQINIFAGLNDNDYLHFNYSLY